MSDKKRVEQRAIVIKQDELEILSDQFNAPTIYVDGAHGFVGTGNVVKWNLFQVVQEVATPGSGDSVMKKQIVARLVMEPSVALSIGNWLLEQVQDRAKPEDDAGKK